MLFDADGIGNERLDSLLVGDCSFIGYRDEKGEVSCSITLSLCDLPGLHSFVVGNLSLFPIVHMKLMSCHGICYSPIDICESVSCRLGDRSMFTLSLESSSSLWW